MSFRPVARPVPSWPTGPLRFALFVGLPLFSLLVLWSVTNSGLVMYPAALMIIVALTWLIWCYPFPATLALLLIAPMNRFLLMLLYTLTNSVLLLRTAQLWKDLLILVLVARVIHEAFLRRKAPRLYFLDLLIALFILYCAVFLIYPGPDAELTLMTRVLGMRFDTFFLLAYFVGRGLPMTRGRARTLLLVAVPVCLAIAGVAFWQWLRPEQAEAAFERLGYSDFRLVVGATDPDLVRTRLIDGAEIPRAASLAMGDLALAFYQVLAIAVAAALFFVLGGGMATVLGGGYLLLMIATLLTTNNRSGLLAMAGILALAALWTRNFVRIAIVALCILAAACGYFMSGKVSIAQFRALFSTQEDSAAAHVDVVQNSLRIIAADPLGQGLGSAGPISARESDAGAFITESWYLQLAIEIGVVGAFIFALITALAVAQTGLSAMFVRDPWLRALTLAAFGAAAGYAVVGAVLHVWEVTPVSMIVWLFIGIAVNAPALEREWRGEEAPRRGTRPRMTATGRL